MVRDPDRPAGDDFSGSGCENTNWTTVPAEERSSRIYLLQESGSAYFRVNEIVLTLKDPKAARAAGDIQKYLTSCKDRKLTAAVSKPHKVSSIGARASEVTGLHRDRAAEGGLEDHEVPGGRRMDRNKLIYTFANPPRLRLHQRAVGHHRGARRERITQINSRVN